MNKLLRYCLCLILLCCTFSPQAQPSWHYLEKLTTADGLSSNATRDIIQDQNGFLWVATAHGLNRYDGSEVEQYFAGSHSLPGNSIHRLIRTDSFHIAIATDQGLSILDTRKYIFQNKFFQFDPAWKSYDNQLLFMEKDVNGNLWIGTPISIYRLDKNFHLQKAFHSAYTFQDIGKFRISYVYRIIPLSTGEVLVWLSSGLHIWEPGADTLIKVQKHPVNKWSFLAGSSYYQCAHVFDHYLIYLNYSKQNLVVCDEKTGKKISSPLPFNDRKQAAVISNVSALSDQWIALSFKLNGLALIKLQHKNGQFNIFYDSTIYFPKNIFRKAIQDNEGNWWITTDANGLLKISPDKQLFRKKELVDEKTKRPSHFEISSFYKINNKIFIASYGDGFYIWDPASGKLKHHSAKYRVYSENMVWNFRLHSKDTLWLGTQQGLLWYDLQNNHIGRIEQHHPSVLDSFAITTQFTDSKNLVWMGLGHGKGVCVYDKIKKSFRAFPNNNNAYPYRYPVSVAEDKNENLWFVSDATSDLVLWNRKEKEFKKVIIPLFKRKTYVHTGKLYLDKKNNVIWYGVQNAGLVRYNIATGNAKTYGMERGLSTDMIFSIVKDKKGILWLATAQGISSFDPVKERFINYNISDGLSATYFSTDLFYDTLSDIIYAGARGHVVYFLPKMFKINKPPLHAKITGFKINNKRLLSPEDQKIKLPWKSNDITLSFTAVNLANGHGNKYAYKLGNEDTQWTELGAQRQIRFASLNPGNYIFTIKAARRDGNWSPFTDQIKFTIRPPFVRTMWFYLLTVVFIGGIIYSWYRYRLTNILHLEKMRSRISHDLHDDIGSHLTNIGMMSQIARQNRQDLVQQNVWLERIQEESQTISQSMREIIWNINPDNDSLQEALPRMLRYASGLLENKNIIVQASIPDLNGIKMDMEKRRDLFLIFKEIIHNIVKHSGAKQTVIAVNLDDKMFQLRVADDGKGFEKGHLAFQNGLHYMWQRAEKHHWKLKVGSTPGKGTQINLEMKIT